MSIIGRWPEIEKMLTMECRDCEECASFSCRFLSACSLASTSADVKRHIRDHVGFKRGLGCHACSTEGRNHTQLLPVFLGRRIAPVTNAAQNLILVLIPVKMDTGIQRKGGIYVSRWCATGIPAALTAVIKEPLLREAFNCDSE